MVVFYSSRYCISFEETNFKFYIAMSDRLPSFAAAFR